MFIVVALLAAAGIYWLCEGVLLIIWSILELIRQMFSGD